MVMVSPSANVRMCNEQVEVPFNGPWARPLMNKSHEPQMPSRQSWSKATGSSPWCSRSSLSTSSISRNDIAGEMSRTWYSTRRPVAWRFFCRQIRRAKFRGRVLSVGWLMRGTGQEVEEAGGLARLSATSFSLQGL